MKNVKISIVIAVYNIEEYIKDCILSVTSQNFEDYEVILVDDGSTDNSGDICESYAGAHVFVYHKENGGLSDARNYGLAKAQGEYVLFVDGDDKIFPDTCKHFYEVAKKTGADVVIGEAQLSNPIAAMERYERIARESFVMHKAYTGKEYLRGCLEGGALRVDAWRHFYRRAFLLDNKLYFQKGIAHEDEEFTPRVLLKADRIALTDAKIYYYNNDRAGSIMNSVNPKKIKDKLLIYDKLFNYYQTVTPRKLRRLLEDDLSWKYMDCHVAYAQLGLEDYHFRRFFPLRLAWHPKRRVKAMIFAISPTLYRKIF